MLLNDNLTFKCAIRNENILTIKFLIEKCDKYNVYFNGDKIIQYLKKLKLCHVAIQVLYYKIYNKMDNYFYTSSDGRKIHDYLNTILKKYHNKDLKKEPHVHRIHNNGKITVTKGNYLFGWRSVFIEFDPRNPGKYIPLSSLDFEFSKNIFPIINSEFDGETGGYAIVSLDDAIYIREIMIELASSFNFIL